MFGKPECDVLQPEPHSGEDCNTLSHKGLTNVNIQKGMLYCHCNILRKTIIGYLDSVPSLTFNTAKTLLIMHAFHSSRHLQSKWMLYFIHA